MAIENRDPRRGGPAQVGRYQIIERIGRGSMGVVYRGRDDAMDRDVAVKVLVADLEDEPDIRVRFHREAEAAARLSHPNIITIFDVGEDGGHFYIVMELLRGATLKDFLNRSPAPSLARRLDLMIQLCAGLGAAHSATIYHRDIKPGNVFVRGDGTLKILDFGVARLANSGMTAAGFVVGTPDYMSPEQARGAEIDGRSDIFSAGGVFYYLLTGRKPFPASDMRAVFRQLEHSDPEPIGESEAPPQLAQLVLKALTKDRDARQQTCQELLTELVEVRRECDLGVPWQSANEDIWGQDSANPTSSPGATSSGANSSGSSTEDTVDRLPLSARDTEETIGQAVPRTWLENASGHAEAAITGLFARMRRPAKVLPTKPAAKGNKRG